MHSGAHQASSHFKILQDVVQCNKLVLPVGYEHVRELDLQVFLTTPIWVAFIKLASRAGVIPLNQKVRDYVRVHEDQRYLLPDSIATSISSAVSFLFPLSLRGFGSLIGRRSPGAFIPLSNSSEIVSLSFWFFSRARSFTRCISSSEISSVVFIPINMGIWAQYSMATVAVYRLGL